jgi:hypothetical protein
MGKYPYEVGEIVSNDNPYKGKKGFIQVELPLTNPVGLDQVKVKLLKLAYDGDYIHSFSLVDRLETYGFTGEHDRFYNYQGEEIEASFDYSFEDNQMSYTVGGESVEGKPLVSINYANDSEGFPHQEVTPGTLVADGVYIRLWSKYLRMLKEDESKDVSTGIMRLPLPIQREAEMVTFGEFTHFICSKFSQ